MSIRKKARKKAAAIASTASYDAAEVADIATANPYIKRLIEDAELRDSVKAALDATRSAYTRLANGKIPAKVLVEDKKLHQDLKTALEAIRNATATLSDAPKKRRRRFGLRRMVLLAGAGSVAAVATSEKLRSKILDTLFGAEEEFEYTPPAAPAPAPVPPEPAPAA